MVLEYLWYAIVEGEGLEQGDFIDDCEVIIPRYTLIDSTDKTTQDSPLTYQATATAAIYDVVIVSQSCDLENGKLDYVLMYPRWSYKDFAEINNEFKKLDRLEQIRQGRHHRYYMLNKCDFVNLSYEIQIVDLGGSVQCAL